MSFSLRGAFAVGVLTIAGALGAQPVLADTELGHTGTVGVHSIFDTASHAGVHCEYGFNNTYQVGTLQDIYVAPPRMKAVTGNNHQTVGWRAIVQRRWGATGSNPAWTNTFTSVERTAVTNPTTNANFTTSAFISVTPPFPASQHATKFAQYRVIIKMIWHSSSGSIQGTAQHRVDHYSLDIADGHLPRAGNCLAYDPAV